MGFFVCFDFLVMGVSLYIVGPRELKEALFHICICFSQMFLSLCVMRPCLASWPQFFQNLSLCSFPNKTMFSSAELGADNHGTNLTDALLLHPCQKMDMHVPQTLTDIDKSVTNR